MNQREKHGSSSIQTALTACLLTALLLVLSPSCATNRMYPGPERPESETAILVVGQIEVVAVDGKPLKPEHSFWSGYGDFQLLPGKRRITVRPLIEQSRNVGYVREQVTKEQAPVVLEFDAQPGHRYRLWLREFPNRLEAYIVDKTDGKREVSHVVP